MDLAYELHDLVLTLDRYAESILSSEPVNYRRYVALVIVGEHPGLTGRDLARGLRVTEAAVSAIVRRLLSDGFVRDIAPEGTGNIRRLEITDAGRKVLMRCSRLLGNSFDDNVRRLGIDPEELARTIRSIHDEVRTERLPSSTAPTADHP